MTNFWTKAKDFLLGVETEEEEYYEEEFVEDDEDYMYTKSSLPEPKKLGGSERQRGSGGSASGFTVHPGSATGSPRLRQSNVVDINSKRPQVDFCFPKNLESARPVMESTQQGILSVVNLTGVEPRDAQRIVDFVGGATFALDGKITRINDDIILVTPAGVDVHDPAVQKTIKDNVKGYAPSFKW